MRALQEVTRGVCCAWEAFKNEIWPCYRYLLVCGWSQLPKFDRLSTCTVEGSHGTRSAVPDEKSPCDMNYSASGQGFYQTNMFFWLAWREALCVAAGLRLTVGLPLVFPDLRL